jgi:hypothetical protein
MTMQMQAARYMRRAHSHPRQKKTRGVLRSPNRAEKRSVAIAGPTHFCVTRSTHLADLRARSPGPARPPRRAHHLLDESPLLSSIAMPPLHAALLVLPAATAAPLCPRPPLGPSHRAHPTMVRVRAAALRALPWRVGLWPPPSSALPTPKEQSAGSGEAPACCLVGLLVLGALRSVGLTPVMAVGDRLGCRSWTG